MRWFKFLFLISLFVATSLSLWILGVVALGHFVSWNYIIVFIVLYLFSTSIASLLLPWFILYIAGVKRVDSRGKFSFTKERFVLYLMRRRLPLPIVIRIPFRNEIAFIIGKSLEKRLDQQHWNYIGQELEQIFMVRNLLIYQFCAVLIIPYILPIWILEKIIPRLLFTPISLISLAPVSLFLKELRSLFPLYDLSYCEQGKTPLIEKLVVENDALPLNTSLDIYVSVSDYFFSMISLFHRYELDFIREYEMSVLAEEIN